MGGGKERYGTSSTSGVKHLVVHIKALCTRTTDASSASGVKHLVVHVKALCTCTTDANLMRMEVTKRVHHLMFLHCGSGSLDGGCKFLSRHLTAISNPFHLLLNLKWRNQIGGFVNYKAWWVFSGHSLVVKMFAACQRTLPGTFEYFNIFLFGG